MRACLKFLIRGGACGKGNDSSRSLERKDEISVLGCQMQFRVVIWVILDFHPMVTQLIGVE